MILTSPPTWSPVSSADIVGWYSSICLMFDTDLGNFLFILHSLDAPILLKMNPTLSTLIAKK